MEIDLWKAPAMGKDAIGQAVHFIGLMKNRIPRVDGAFLRYVPEAGGAKVIADFEPENVVWAHRARDLAELVGEMVVRGHNDGVRVIARRAM